MYKYSVIGDNTQENREWLEKVGYKPFLAKYGSFLFAVGFDVDMPNTFTTEKMIEPYAFNDFIDCRGNSPLFKAVSAMREDSDYMQYFTNGEDWCKCYLPVFSHFAFHQQVEASMDLIANWHKATLTELQERFKEKIHETNRSRIYD